MEEKSQVRPTLVVPRSKSEVNNGNSKGLSNELHQTSALQKQTSIATHESRSSEQKNRSEPGVLRIGPNVPFIKQPESRNIPEEALNAEVKIIYNGLTAIETKCRTVDQVQSGRTPDGKAKPLTSDHWRALIALHRTLLNEHHDFFLASQHPSASPALKRLATRYSMPARLWRHGIHSFLEVLRHRLPDSLEYMLLFIYLAYQMMSLLYETVPAFESTWIECLGDLGRYRMAIEDIDKRDREIWNNVARYWYAKAADRNPHVGRLYHHLAILARSDPLQQGSLYTRSLISVESFGSALDSIRTLFDPITSNHVTYAKSLAVDKLFVKMLAMLFYKNKLESFDALKLEYMQHLDQTLDQVFWKDRGVKTVICLIGALLDFGQPLSPLHQAFQHIKKNEAQVIELAEHERRAAKDTDVKPLSKREEENDSSDSPSKVAFVKACELLSVVMKLILQRHKNDKTLSFLHIICVFLSSLFKIKEENNASFVKTVYYHIPWYPLNRYFKVLAEKENVEPGEDPFHMSGTHDPSPCPEDYQIRGQEWCQEYFPLKWFENAGLDEEEREVERLSTGKLRVYRLLSIHQKLTTVSCVE